MLDELLCRFVVVATALVLLAATPAAAEPVPKGAKWYEATIESTDGVKLHVDILRPEDLPLDEPGPVIMAIGPYFNHSGQVGPVGPLLDAPYDPVGPTEGPSGRFHDLVEGAKLMERGYTFVMVDIRGFGGSSGCLDWGGPGEQADVVKSVEWIVSQSWSNGKVGMYGKSYDAVTGLIGANLEPAGLAAVVAQQPVYDLYRYLYGDGIPRFNAVLTPALYDLIDATPGPATDTLERPDYQINGANDSQRPGCKALNWWDQAGNNDHESNYWRKRNLIPGATGSDVPLFVTAGLPENNTVSDGLAQYMENHTGYERAWLGPWDHVRGNDREDDGQLIMGRKGWFDEVMRFYDRFLLGLEPDVEDPPVAVQTYDGKWRAEEVWPPLDAVDYTSRLGGGDYFDDGYGFTWSSAAREGLWTFSKPLPHDAHMVGSPRALVDVDSPSNGNLVVSLYDVDPTGTATLLTRQAHLLRTSGEYSLDLWSLDYKLPAGHRIGARLADADRNWWQHIPSFRDVTVNGVTLELPFLTHERTETIEGDASSDLPKYRSRTVTLSKETIEAGESEAFVLPPAQKPKPTSGEGSSDATGGSGAGGGSTAPEDAGRADPPRSAPDRQERPAPESTGDEQTNSSTGEAVQQRPSYRVRNARLRRALKRGLRLRARCSEPCRARGSLKLSRRDARRYGIDRRIVARGGSKRTFSGRKTFRLRFTREARRKLRKADDLTFRLRFVTRGVNGTREVALARYTLRG